MLLPEECAELEIPLSAYADGELHCEKLRLHVQRHLHLCIQCCETLAEYQTLHALMVATPPPQMPDDLAERILARLSRRTPE